MTKQELIEKWRNKEIAIENDYVEAVIKCLPLLGGGLIPKGGARFYFYADDIDGWFASNYNETNLPIKASKALEILSEPETKPEMIKVIYKTPDGKVFDTLELANENIVKLKFQETIANTIFNSGLQPNDAIEAARLCIKYKETLCELLMPANYDV